MAEPGYARRAFRDEDAPALAQIAARAIATIGPHAYSPDQVAAWAARHGDATRYIARNRNGAVITVAVDREDCLVAYSLLEEDGHLDHLYCHPAHTRQGLADRLLAEAEAQTRKSGGKRLYTEASDLARPAFERAGYTMLHQRDFAIDGVPIHNWAMEKRLGPTPAKASAASAAKANPIR